MATIISSSFFGAGLKLKLKTINVTYMEANIKEFLYFKKFPICFQKALRKNALLIFEKYLAF